MVTPALEGIGEHPEFGPLIGQSRNSILKMLEDGRVSDRLGAAAALAVRLVADRASIILVTDGLTDDDTQVMGFERFDSGRAAGLRPSPGDRQGHWCPKTGGDRAQQAPDTLPIIDVIEDGRCGFHG